MTEAARRLELYCRAGRSLNRFFATWTSPLCGNCLEVTARALPGDPRADAVLLDGQFPGCCHAGVADALAVPGAGEKGRFSPGLEACIRAARADRGHTGGKPPAFTLRERQTGRLRGGVGCSHLGPRGCRLGELKAPLCLTYLCGPVRAELGRVAGAARYLGDEDDFCGAAGVLQVILCGELGVAIRAVTELESRLYALGRLLEDAGEDSG